MRLTEKRNNEIGYGYKEYSSEGSAAITKKLGQLEDIFEEYKIEDVAMLKMMLDSSIKSEFRIQELDKQWKNDYNRLVDDYNKLYVEHTVLQIIKEKEVNTRFLRQMFRNENWCRYETYEDYLKKDCKEYKNAYLSVSLLPLDEDEFYLLKRFLLCD